jgi:hypothetical protein
MNRRRFLSFVCFSPIAVSVPAPVDFAIADRHARAPRGMIGEHGPEAVVPLLRKPPDELLDQRRAVH